MVNISLDILKKPWHLPHSPDKCDFTAGTKQWSKSRVPGLTLKSIRHFRALRLFEQTVTHYLYIILNGVYTYCFRKYFSPPAQNHFLKLPLQYSKKTENQKIWLSFIPYANLTIYIILSSISSFHFLVFTHINKAAGFHLSTLY